MKWTAVAVVAVLLLASGADATNRGRKRSKGSNSSRRPPPPSRRSGPSSSGSSSRPSTPPPPPPSPSTSGTTPASGTPPAGTAAIGGPGATAFPGISLPGPGTVVSAGGVISTALLNGNGGSQIASGTSNTVGTGQVFTTKENDGSAFVTGTQTTQAQGTGPSSGNAGVNGAADLLGPSGSRSTTIGSGNSAFVTDPGTSTGSSSTEFNAFANPTQSAGAINFLAAAAGLGGAQTAGLYSLGSQDP